MRHLAARHTTRLQSTQQAFSLPIRSALAVVKRGNGKPTDNDRLYTGSGQLEGITHPRADCLHAYKDFIAKSGTTPGATLNPTVQQDFTGVEQLTLAGDAVKVRHASSPKVELQPCNTAHDVRQVSMDGGQLPLSSRCGAWAIISECSTGLHHFAKRLLCGHEWCSDCGRDGSAAHKRRQARLLPKLQQVARLGYFVIEWPDSLRRVGRGGVSPDMDNLAAFVCPACGGVGFWLRGQVKICSRCHPAADDVKVWQGGDAGLIRGWCYSKGDLRATTKTITDVFAGKRGAGGRGRKRVGGFFARGLARWHWFGDKVQGKYNPHLNVLVDFDSLLDSTKAEWQPVVEDYLAGLRGAKATKATRKAIAATELYLRGASACLPKPLLEGIKAELRGALGCPDLIVHYSFKDKPGQIVQTGRYITRATFKDYDWDEYMAQELWNFRNIRWWGSWTGEAVWELTQAGDEGADVEGLDVIDSLQSGVCPDCGQPLKVLHHDARGQPVYWTRAVDAVYLDVWGAQEIAGTGYYRVPWRGPDPAHLTPEDVIRLAQVEAKASALWRDKCDKPARRKVRQRLDEDELWGEDDGGIEGLDLLPGTAYGVGLPFGLGRSGGGDEGGEHG